MKIVICDDEQAYVDAVASNVHNFFYNHHISHEISTFTDSQKVFEQRRKFDMAFLDIEMTPFNGMELARRLKEINPKIIVFMITSYTQYLDDAMDLNVFRYIQKPLNVPRLIAGLDKAMEILQQTTVPFYLSDKGKTVRIFSDDIVFIEIINRRTQVVTTRTKYVSDTSINDWYSVLPKTSFFMVHSSFIVNVRYVTHYTRELVTLNDVYAVPVAYRKQSAFKQFFSDYCKKLG